MTATPAPSIAHRELAAGRWHTLPLVEQLANVGSEVSRTIRALGTGQTERASNAMTRALELFDLTATDPRWKGPRRREVLGARELFCGLKYSVTPTPGDAEFCERYFLQFAVAVRRARDVVQQSRGDTS